MTDAQDEPEAIVGQVTGAPLRAHPAPADNYTHT